jgi:hypothetical protein
VSTNLPSPNIQDSAQSTKLFFDQYGKEPLQFSANDVEAAIGFFQSRGFDRDAAEITSMVILKQANLDGLPIFKLLDTLGNLDNLEISALVGEILNNNRPSSSTLGFRNVGVTKDPQVRNIAA